MAQGFFPYPGGKAQYADWIIRHFPDHDTYVEPFGGGAGVLFHKPRSKVEVYNDIDGEVWHFFDVFSRRPDDVADRLEDVYYAKQQYDEWIEDIPNDPIDRAARFFFLRYANWGSKLEPANFRRQKHRSTADQFRDAVESLPEKADRLHDVTIENTDWEDVVDRYDSEETLFYIDPPYVEVGDIERIYSHGHDFDHAAFVDRLNDTDGDWVVSFDTLPSKLPSYEATAERKTNNQVGNGEYASNERTERLLMNYDPVDRTGFAGTDQAHVDQFI